MKRNVLLSALFMLFCSGVAAQLPGADADRIFFIGFEDGGAMFTDSSFSLGDSIVGVYYYPQNKYDASLNSISKRNFLRRYLFIFFS